MHGLADMYGCEVKTIKAKEDPALGAAILAGVGAKIFPDVVSACSVDGKEFRCGVVLPRGTNEMRFYF